MQEQEYIYEQLWKDREAEWEQRVRRGDFIQRYPNRVKKSAKKSGLIAKSILRKIGLL